MPSEIFDPTRVTTEIEFGVGTKLSDEGIREYIYVKAANALAVGAVAYIDPDGGANGLTTTLAGGKLGLRLGVCQDAIAASSYGWLQVSGPCAAISVAANPTTGAQMYSTGTSGRIDDTSTNGDIMGIYVVNRSTAGNTSGFLSNPTVQNT